MWFVINEKRNRSKKIEKNRIVYESNHLMEMYRRSAIFVHKNLAAFRDSSKNLVLGCSGRNTEAHKCSEVAQQDLNDGSLSAFCPVSLLTTLDIYSTGWKIRMKLCHAYSHLHENLLTDDQRLW